MRIPLPFAVTDDPKARPTRDLLQLIDADLQALTFAMGLREQRLQTWVIKHLARQANHRIARAEPREQTGKLIGRCFTG
ncbi:hypothetical protein D3C78_1821740 [compost metagenome]